MASRIASRQRGVTAHTPFMRSSMALEVEFHVAIAAPSRRSHAEEDGRRVANEEQELGERADHAPRLGLAVGQRRVRADARGGDASG